MSLLTKYLTGYQLFKNKKAKTQK